MAHDAIGLRQLHQWVDDLTSIDEECSCEAREALFSSELEDWVAANGRSILPTLIDRFRDGGDDEREVIGILLTSVGDDVAVEALIDLLDEHDETLVGWAICALDQFAFGDDVVERIVGAMYHPSSLVARSAAVVTLPTSLAVLRGRLEVSRWNDVCDWQNDDVFFPAEGDVEELVESDILELGQPSWRILVDALQSPHSEVREAARSCLPFVDAPHVDALLVALDHPCAAVRQVAVEAIPVAQIGKGPVAIAVRFVLRVFLWVVTRSFVGGVVYAGFALAATVLQWLRGENVASWDWGFIGLIVGFGALIGPLLFLGEEIHLWLDRRREPIEKSNEVGRYSPSQRLLCLEKLEHRLDDVDGDVRKAANEKMADVRRRRWRVV